MRLGHTIYLGMAWQFRRELHCSCGFADCAEHEIRIERFLRRSQDVGYGKVLTIEKMVPPYYLENGQLRGELWDGFFELAKLEWNQGLEEVLAEGREEVAS